MKACRQHGFVLSELLVTGLLTAFLMLGMIQMAAGVSRGLLLIESQSGTHQGGRFAIDQIRDTAMSAGFHPAPWETEDPLTAFGAAVRDGGTGGNDTLVLRQRSDRNCYGNINATAGHDGRPAFFLRESTFEVTTAGNLAHTCWFGADEASMVRQINREGIVKHVESFQVLYAEDTDGDRHANHMVRANGWSEASQIVGLEVGLLLTTDQRAGHETQSSFSILDESVTPNPDGHLRKSFTFSIPLISRLR